MSRKARLWDFSREIEGSVIYVMVEGEPIDEIEMERRVQLLVDELRRQRQKRMEAKA